VNEVVARHPALAALRQAVAELSLISHVTAVNYDAKAPRDTSEDIGGRRPPGGDREHPNRKDVDEMVSYNASYHRRTVHYFVVQVERCETVERLIALRDEALSTLESWRRQPIPEGQEPEYGSPQWKRFVAESREDAGELARRFGVSRRYINRIRAEYRR
jgi:hypothetical protein